MPMHMHVTMHLIMKSRVLQQLDTISCQCVQRLTMIDVYVVVKYSLQLHVEKKQNKKQTGLLALLDV